MRELLPPESSSQWGGCASLWDEITCYACVSVHLLLSVVPLRRRAPLQVAGEVVVVAAAIAPFRELKSRVREREPPASGSAGHNWGLTAAAMPRWLEECSLSAQ
ncbi:hypothetical protein MRX96_044249 [Rhipicephalus microplus]